LGQKGLKSEAVAERLVRDVKEYLAHTAPVGEHLADQLMIPIALGGGSFVTRNPSLHTMTQVELIPQFLDVEFQLEQRNGEVLIEAITRPQ
jgi:RNA 3'-terminal phosphate cyclase (ATP)